MFHAVYTMIENINVLSRSNNKPKKYKILFLVVSFRTCKILILMKKCGQNL